MSASPFEALPAALAHLVGIDAALLARAAKIRLACFDVDGTLTDGRLIYDGGSTSHSANEPAHEATQSRESKAFHVHDGQGLVLLRKAGIEVALITARRSAAAERRGRELAVRVHTGSGDKLAQVDALCAELGIGRDAVAFMGDDLPDLPAMRAVGLAAAPADAHAWTANAAHWRTRASAGMGAARELCDLILVAQKKLRIEDARGGDASAERASEGET
jgi:3-deoxy-D-manno-octulosonate 8-phosphate phosphatase (KDO 8-P phosphatase)